MTPAFTCSKCGHQDVVEEYELSFPHHLLETNDPPLASEKKFLWLAKLDFEREIAAVGSQIWHLKQVLVALMHQREKLVESLVAVKGALSPIRWVPAELIGEIVLLALTERDRSIQGYGGKKFFPEPLSG
ncbi:hypothetical protein C8J56DRAFT_883900 [Mycena floridula]|nr:hypothetical protein C8J56DRAFT_883900 [Mycena floridula]